MPIQWTPRELRYASADNASDLAVRAQAKMLTLMQAEFGISDDRIEAIGLDNMVFNALYYGVFEAREMDVPDALYYGVCCNAAPDARND